jgi:GT2 family glycosyltransferase
MPAPAHSPSRKIVVLGMMTKMPVAGVVWQYVHYLVGLRRLGWDPYYVETHARTPSMLMEREGDDGAARAAAWIDGVLRRFDFGDRWAYVALHDDGRCLGMSRAQIDRLYGEAAALINMHGGTAPLPELAGTDRLVYLETDPVQLHVELSQGRRETVDFLDAHGAFFTYADNHAGADCLLPQVERFDFHATRQPVVIDMWDGHGTGRSGLFTTIGNWRQEWRDLQFEGERYTWSKHHEFMKVIDLPRRAGRRFELALSSYGDGDRALLERHGWKVRPALDFSTDPDRYRSYIGDSAAEFTVAKDQNVRLRTGWFSDRSATYLAAGRPVITQDTGLASVFPTGRGLLPFSSLDEAAEAVDAVTRDPAGHSRAAFEIAREHFDHDVVLSRMLSQIGLALGGSKGRSSTARDGPFPREMPLEPTSRRPTQLAADTLRALSARRFPSGWTAPPAEVPAASVVVVTRDNLPFLRICVESVLAHSADSPYELIVVDNGSSDGSGDYLERLAAVHRHVAVVGARENLGFARGCNRGIERARGDALVLLNDDAAVAPGWLSRLLAHLDRPGVGLVGPSTNRIGNEAETETAYTTWGGFLDEAAQRASEHDGQAFEIPTLAMFCLALRREVCEKVGPLDERFEIGLLEDDDYALRVRNAGMCSLCADDVLVHHFGETSFGKLVSSGERARILAANRRRFEEKWGTRWRPYARRPRPSYEDLTRRVRAAVEEVVPEGAGVLVVTRGDDGLLALDRRAGAHFPQDASGTYAGHHPADSAEAIAELERLRAAGMRFLVFPETCLWWLEHYDDLRRHLEARYSRVLERADTAVIYSLERPAADGRAAAPLALGSER